MSGRPGNRCSAWAGAAGAAGSKAAPAGGGCRITSPGLDGLGHEAHDDAIRDLDFDLAVTDLGHVAHHAPGDHLVADVKGARLAHRLHPSLLVGADP